MFHNTTLSLCDKERPKQVGKCCSLSEWINTMLLYTRLRSLDRITNATPPHRVLKINTFSILSSRSVGRWFCRSVFGKRMNWEKSFKCKKHAETLRSRETGSLSEQEPQSSECRHRLGHWWDGRALAYLAALSYESTGLLNYAFFQKILEIISASEF